ncbi:LOW QUALITY PROTEIN: hypothetical protein CFC21_005612 [Triticum aestivum]|uniref:TTF-type domain-containing protein n=2 Tax=Triticum aestivum TaxID=4565 RepID=A0A3B5YSQ2_WHEAT|nr:LOW QUALITY PROTEIN: hypothetical protein CFC21_005612 [Triticum aestivum]
MDNTNVSDHPSIFNSSVAEFASVDEVPVITVDIYDPSNLGNLDNNSRGILVEKGPKREEENTKYSLDENSRYFSYTHYSRNNCNGEVHDRKWLVISKDAKKCFLCYKLFNSNKCKSALGHKGFCDWKHINERPKGHAASVYHITNINSWNELSTRLRQHETN